MRNLIFISIAALLFFACSKEKEEVVPLDIGHNYAGLILGNYVVYDVDSLYYDDFAGTVDTFQFQIREEVAELYMDLENDEAFKINRYRKDHDTLSWYLQDVWNAKITSTNYQKVEENIRFVKLIFPVREGSNWNGNAMNNYPEERYNYVTIDQAEIIGGNSLAQVLTVSQFEEINLIQQQLFEEKFAVDVGLVYKKSMDLVRDNLSSPWRGYDVTMTLNSYGN